MILWMILIFILSSRSTIGIGKTNLERVLIFKSLHFIEYFILYIFTFLAFKNHPKSILISYLYALSDEYHQSFVPFRQASFIDTIVDFVGIISAYFFISLLQKNKFSSILKL
jgi:VanZ family protein